VREDDQRTDLCGDTEGTTDLGIAPGKPMGSSDVNVFQNRHGLELIKTGVVSAVPEVLLDLGLDPHSVIAAAGLCPELFDDPENVIPFAALGRLIDECAKASHCEHFGLLVGQKALASSLGLVGLLVQHSPIVLDALENLARHLHLQDGRGIPTLEVSRGVASLGYRIFEISMPGAFELVDAAIATRFNIMRQLCGRRWRPIEVTLPRPKPQITKRFDRFFEAPVRFGEEQAAIWFSADWLPHPVPGASPLIRKLLEDRIGELEAQSAGSFAVQLRRFVRMLILARRCSMEAAARLFAMEPRSFARRLDREAIEFRGLVNEIRYEVAQQLISETSLPIAQIAAILGYSEASAFTRAFRRWSATTPKSWRTEHTDDRVEADVISVRHLPV
jgi:AraC-like DNA-binding protein